MLEYFELFFKRSNHHPRALTDGTRECLPEAPAPLVTVLLLALAGPRALFLPYNTMLSRLRNLFIRISPDFVEGKFHPAVLRGDFGDQYTQVHLRNGVVVQVRCQHWHPCVGPRPPAQLPSLHLAAAEVWWGADFSAATAGTLRTPGDSDDRRGALGLSTLHI